MITSMKKCTAYVLFVALLLCCCGCKAAQSAPPVSAAPTPAAQPVQEPELMGDPENPLKTHMDSFAAACADAFSHAEEAAKQDITLLSETLQLSQHAYALQMLLYAPANLLYTSEGLFDGSVYGALYGNGSVWQRAEETTFSCTLGDGSVVSGTLQNAVLTAQQTRQESTQENVEAEETGADEAEALEQAEPQPPTVLCRGGVIQQEDGWYSYYQEENGSITLLYFHEDTLLFTDTADAGLLTNGAWLTMEPLNWGERCFLVTGADAARATRPVPATPLTTDAAAEQTDE